MDRIRLPFLAAALCAAGAAGAQGTGIAQPQPEGAQQQASQQQALQQQAPQQQAAPQAAQQGGFFAPTPGGDPSLFHTLPAEAYPEAQAQAPASAQRGAAAAAPSTPPLVVVVPESPSGVTAQLDRSQAEADQAAARMSRMPAPINGAFTGLTDEADRR